MSANVCASTVLLTTVLPGTPAPLPGLALPDLRGRRSTRVGRKLPESPRDPDHRNKREETTKDEETEDGRVERVAQE